MSYNEFVIPHGKEATLMRCMGAAYEIIEEMWPAAVIEDLDGNSYEDFRGVPDELPQLMGPPHDTVLFVYRDPAAQEEWNAHGGLGNNNNQIELCWTDDSFIIVADHDHDVSDLVKRMTEALA